MTQLYRGFPVLGIVLSLGYVVVPASGAEVRPAIASALQSALDLAQAGKFDAASKTLHQVEELPDKTPQETNMVRQIQVYIERRALYVKQHGRLPPKVP